MIVPDGLRVNGLQEVVLAFRCDLTPSGFERLKLAGVARCTFCRKLRSQKAKRISRTTGELPWRSLLMLDEQFADILRPAEIARFLRMGKNRVYDLIRHQAIPVFVVGGRYYASREALRRWAEEASEGRRLID